MAEHDFARLAEILGPKETFDALSLVPLFVEPCFRERTLSFATAFLYSHDKETFLISNWHVLAGRDRGSGQALNKFGAVPDRLRLQIFTNGEDGRWSPREIPLTSDIGEPLWLEHPIFGQQVDVAAIHVTLPELLISPTINQQAMNSGIWIKVAQDVFILGFPLRDSSGRFLPVWKRGSIATEPFANFEGLPMFLVDSATYSGMSGSPVIVRIPGDYEAQISDPILSSGLCDRFIGVYSGRRINDENGATQLGEVWKEAVIDEIIRSQRRASVKL